MDQEGVGWSVCPPQQCVEMEVCVLPCALRVLAAGCCCFSKNNNFVGGGKEMEKTKDRPALAGEWFFFVGGSRRAKLKFLMSVWQARQSGQALVEIFEKVGKKHAQNKRKCAREKIPQKKKKQKGREETRNTGNW